MRRTMLKSKIHRATVTAASVDYEGSITIDSKLMEAADILSYEQVHVFDVDNGSRLVTYAIPGKAGEVCVNGAAARLVDVGNQVIIVSFCELASAELGEFSPVLVFVDDRNGIKSISKPSLPGLGGIDPASSIPPRSGRQP